MGMVKPLACPMAAAILFGVGGHLAATLVPVLGCVALLGMAGFGPLPFFAMPHAIAFVLIAFCAAFRGFLRYGEQLCNHYIAFKLLATIRDKVFGVLRTLAPAKMEARNTGNLIALVTSDIELLEVFYAHTISPVAIAILYSLALMVVLACIHPLFALVALGAYLWVGLFIPLITSKAGGRAGLAFRTGSGDLSGYFLDSLRGLKEVVQYGQGEARLEGIRHKTDSLHVTQAHLKRVEGLMAALTGASILVFSLGMLALGFVLSQDSQITPSGAVLAFVMMLGSFGPVLALSSLANNLAHTFAAGNRILDLLDEKPLTSDVMQGKSPAFEGLHCEAVCFGYEGSDNGAAAETPDGYTPRNILEDFSLTLEKNRVLGIMGKSGTGKSTLLRLLMRFWDVDSGSIEVSGTDIRTINTTSLRNLESLVTQETQLFDDTIARNIAVARLGAGHDQIVSAAQSASLHDFITTLPQGYETRVGELGDALSGGEKQRIGLARAFLHDAPLMLLDEPTSNLDSLNEGIILKALDAHAREKTVVLVSHRESTMAIADQILIVGEPSPTHKPTISHDDKPEKGTHV
jgi:ATP-binding cassette subfamily C protein